MRTTLAFIVFAAGAALFTPLFLPEPNPRPVQGGVGEQVVDREPRRLSAQEVVAALEAQGYLDFILVSREDGRYLVKARNEDGRDSVFYVDPMTGRALTNGRLTP